MKTGFKRNGFSHLVVCIIFYGTTLLYHIK